MALKLIFMGTPEFAVPILDSIKKSNHNLLAVYTQHPKKSNRGLKLNLSPVHQYCNKIKINVRHPKLLEDKELEYIKSLKPDLVVVAAFGKIIPSKFLNLSNIEFINIHASLLPRWRGAAPIQRSLIEMDKETGISIMKIKPKLDTGPFMMQEKIKIEENDNYISLSKKLSNLGSKIILNSLDLIESNNFKFVEQDETKATYAKKIDKKESEINWKIPAKNLIAKINGLNPFPGAWFEHKGSRLKIIEAAFVNQSGKVGEILDDSLTIACEQNAVRILSIQKEGKKILDIKDFLTGYRIKKGELIS